MLVLKVQETSTGDCEENTVYRKRSDKFESNNDYELYASLCHQYKRATVLHLHQHSAMFSCKSLTFRPRRAKPLTKTRTLDSHWRRESERHWLAAQGGPDGQRVVTNLLRGGAAGGSASLHRKCDGNWGTTRVAIGSESETRNMSAVTGIFVDTIGLALTGEVLCQPELCISAMKEDNLLSRHALHKHRSQVVVLNGQNWPIGEPHHLLHDGFDPYL